LASFISHLVKPSTSLEILRDQHLGAWRRKAFESLKRLFEGRLDEAKKWAKDGRGEDSSISVGIKRALDAILREPHVKGRRISTVKLFVSVERPGEAE
jgi:hypothetical protein